MMRSVPALVLCVLTSSTTEAAAPTAEEAWQARCVGRLERSLAEAQRIEPAFGAPSIKAPYEWNDGGKYQDAAPGAELRLQKSAHSAFEVPFSVAVHLEMTGHESEVPQSWTARWGTSLDPTRRFFWARERQELVDLAQPGDTTVWRYLYSRRQGNVVASISGDHQLARPELLRRLVQLFEPAVDDCLLWGAALPKVRSPHPVTDWPVSPQEAQKSSASQAEPPFQVQVLGGGPAQLKLIDADEKLTWSCSVRGPDSACGPAHGWLRWNPFIWTKPYKLRVESGKTAVVRTFFVDGTEERFTAVIVAGDRPRILLSRILRSSGDVTLEQAWAPTAEGTPLYRLHNRSPRTIYGTSTLGNFFGNLERWDADHWAAVPNVACGTVSGSAPLASAESTSAELGCVIDQPRLRPGRYRFWLTYAHQSCVIERWTEVQEEFAVDTEFTIGPPA